MKVIKKKGTPLWKALLLEKRLPFRYWFFFKNVSNSYYYYSNRVYNLIRFSKKHVNPKKIVFTPIFHEFGGESVAIATTANLLSKKYDVSFVSFPKSIYNGILGKSVKIISDETLEGDVYIINDAVLKIDFLKKLKKLGKRIVISYHLLSKRPNFEEEEVKRVFNIVDKIVFVSKIQYKHKIRKNKYTIIPNLTSPIIKKDYYSLNVGIIGRLEDKLKGINESIEIALKSKAKKIHLCGSNGNTSHGRRVEIHPWTNNKNKVYNSFGVLVSMSHMEVLPLIILESMSAGIPMVLSDIPAHRQFKDCPGVVLVRHNDADKAAIELNRLLAKKDKLRDKVVEYWKNNYSEDMILDEWSKLIKDL